MSSQNTFQQSKQAYTNSTGTSGTGRNLVMRRNPNANDVNYDIGTFWQNTVNESLWYLNSQSSVGAILQSQWISIDAALQTLSDSANTVVDPSSSSSTPPNNIQLINLDGSISILSDPTNHRIIFGLTGGSTAVDSFSPDTGVDPVVPTIAGLVRVRGQTVPNTSGIRVTGALNELDIAMFSPFAGGFDFSTSISGGTVELRAINNSNTASSNAALEAVVGGTSAGVAITLYQIGGGSIFSTGITAADGTYRMSPSMTGIGTGNDIITISQAGAITFHQAYTFPAADGTVNQSLITNGAGQLSFASAGVVGPGRFPITPYVVGPVASAGYQTIQSAADAANADGGGTVYIQSSAATYAEDLLLYENVSFVGVSGNSDIPTSSNTVTISGTHTPPATGYVSFTNIYLLDATAIFSSAIAGTAQIVLENCVTEVTNGYVFDMPNWVAPGAFIGFDCNSIQGVNSAWVNNTEQATTYIQDSVIGSGTGNTMIVSGILTLKNVDFNCPLELRKNTIQNIDSCRFGETVTATVNATGIINFSRFDPASSGPCFVMSSTDPIRLSNCLFNTPNNPAIDGAGGGLLTLTSATFVDNTIIGGTVNVAAASAFLPASFGATGQVFTSNGPGVVPSFQNAPTAQPAFLATHTADQNNATGAGAGVTVNYTSVVFDQASNYDGTNTFTAPVTGKYVFTGALFFTSLLVANTTGDINIITTSATYTFRVNIGAVASGGTASMTLTTPAVAMTAGDTCHVSTVVSGGAGNTVNIPGSSTTTYFGGYLVF